MPTSSPLPSVDIPDAGIYQFLFGSGPRNYSDNKVIFVDPYSNRSYTYAQTKSAVDEFGKGLKGLWDWQKGDVLGIYSPNSIDIPIVAWGTHFAGGTVSPANPGYTVDELVFQLKDSGAKALLTSLAQLDIARAAAKQVGISEDRIALLGDKKDPEHRIKHFTSVRNTSRTARWRAAKVDPDKDLAFLVYSSGTTGKPKGVMLSHRNLVANILQYASMEPELSSEDNMLAFLPFFHIYGLLGILHHSLYRGMKVVVMPQFGIEEWCRLVQEQRITYGLVVPPVVLLLSKHPCVPNYDLSSIRMLNSGAAPLTREIVEQLHNRTSLPVKQGYGLSETSPCTHIQAWCDWQKYIGSVGKMVPNTTAKFMSPEGTEVPTGQVGELWISGPNIFKGYLNNAEGTANALTPDGYLKTGDIGYLDAEGNFYITDRLRELIKYKGFQVPPAELEGLLVSHEKIDDVAVMGVYREDLATEVPLAYIVPKQGVKAGKALETEIVEWLAGKVANHKRLRGGIQFTDAIPKSAAGKILRRMLKTKYQEEVVEKAKAKL